MAINFDKYPQQIKVRHHISAFNYLPAEDLEYIPDTYPPVINSIDWKEYFSNGKPPDILDIGCGKGIFLLSLAEKHPEKNILGIEIREPLVDWNNDVVKNVGLLNCHTLRYSVANGLDFIESNSIDEIFYLFPDPWPKRRHYKRRAFGLHFLNNCYRVLKENGKLNLATDVDYVNEYHKKTLAKHNLFTYNELQQNEWDYPLTNQEKFCNKKNISVFRLQAIK